MGTSEEELIWQGRIHVGDEPGVYGDAAYAGISLQLPLTLRKDRPDGSDETTVTVRTEGVRTFAGYPGHLITVQAYTPSSTDPNHYTETVVASARLTSADDNRKNLLINLASLGSPIFLAVGIRVDTEVPPSLYDDFVCIRLSQRSTDLTYSANLGFHRP